MRINSATLLTLLLVVSTYGRAGEMNPYIDPSDPKAKCYRDDSSIEVRTARSNFLELQHTYDNAPEGYAKQRALEKLQEFKDYRPKNSVHIDVKQTQAKAGDPVLLDASGSKTPSGKIVYGWPEFDPKSSHGLDHGDNSKATNTKKANASGTYYLLDFSIYDPFCGTGDRTQIRVPFK